MSINTGNQLIADMCKALSSPNRIHIMRFLQDGPRCVCEIIEELGAGQSNISQHLNVLKNAGLVECHKEGLKVIYGVRYQDIFTIIDTVEKVIMMQTQDTQRVLRNAI